MQGWDGNGRQFCVRMHNSAGDIGDKGCEQQFAFLCQYDCDDVYTGSAHTHNKRQTQKVNVQAWSDQCAHPEVQLKR